MTFKTKKCEFSTWQKQFLTFQNPQALVECDLCVEFPNFLSNFMKLKAKYYIRGTKLLLFSFRKFGCCWQSLSPPHLIFPAQNSTEIQATYHLRFLL